MTESRSDQKNASDHLKDLDREVILLCGGRSAEHEVSLQSARAVSENLAAAGFGVLVTGLSCDGGTLKADGLREHFPEHSSSVRFHDGEWINLLLSNRASDRVVFPVLHGPYGEDGTVQGMLELLDLPYVGASVGGSAVGINKIYCKSILHAHGVPVLPWLAFSVEDWKSQRKELERRADEELGYPLFVKPSSMGSSVGISRCVSVSELRQGVLEALQYDDWILVEKGIEAREIEVSLLGNLEAQCSLPGEIIPSDTFYSYEAKYLTGTSRLLIPAPLETVRVDEIRRTALHAYRLLQLEGMARMDFLLDRSTGALWLNEPNTIPGFTEISMYPKLWEASGLSYVALLSRLVDLGVERWQRRRRLRTQR